MSCVVFWYRGVGGRRLRERGCAVGDPPSCGIALFVMPAKRERDGQVCDVDRGRLKSCNALIGGRCCRHACGVKARGRRRYWVFEQVKDG